jgi:hypothetical protein
MRLINDGAGPTEESVMVESLAILRDWHAVTREVIADVAKVEKSKPKHSKRDKAIGRWQIYLGVMLVKVAEGIADLAPSRNFRPMIILARSMFEYLTKTHFFLEHRKEAFEQYSSIGARMFSELSKLQHHDPTMGAKLAAAYLEWKRTSGTRDEYSGNLGLTKMHLATVDKASVKQDKNGVDYTEVFQTAYSLPSLYAHGEPLIMPEIFPKLGDDTNWDYREDATFMDALSMVGVAGAYLNRWCALVSKAYGLDFARLRALNERVNRRLVNEGRLRGIPVALIPHARKKT